METAAKIYGECRHGLMIQIFLRQVDNPGVSVSTDWIIYGILIDTLNTTPLQQFFAGYEISGKFITHRGIKDLVSIINEISNFIFMPIEELPLHINDEWIYGKLAGWILENHKIISIQKETYDERGRFI